MMFEVVALSAISSGSALAVHTEPGGSAASTDVGVIEEVVVTARRKEENMQSVPLAVTALNAEQFARTLATRTEDLRFSVPSLMIAPSNFGTSVPAFTIRGQRQLESLVTQDTSVGLYLNEV